MLRIPVVWQLFLPHACAVARKIQASTLSVMDAGDVLNEDLCDRILEGESGYFHLFMQMVKY
jgi:ABC-type phosphonate transport system ATPase subunit